MNGQAEIKTDTLALLQDKFNSLQTRATLSTLWIFMLLNMLVRDIHEFGRAGFLEEMMTGVINGVQLTEELFLVSGIVLEIPIAMVILSRLLPYRLSRWANMFAGVLAIGIIINLGVNDLDDIWFAGIEILTLVFIMWTAWRWRE